MWLPLCPTLLSLLSLLTAPVFSCHFSNMSSSHLREFALTVPFSWKTSFTLPYSYPPRFISHFLQIFGLMSPPMTFLSAHCIWNIHAACSPSLSLYICSTLLHCTHILSLSPIKICVFSPTLMQTPWRWRRFFVCFLVFYLKYQPYLVHGRYQKKYWIMSSCCGTVG